MDLPHLRDALPPTASGERLLELLLSRATEGLTEFELRELDALQRKHPEIDDGTIDCAAAAIDVELHAHSAQHEPMPDSVRARLAELADSHSGVVVSDGPLLVVAPV